MCTAPITMPRPSPFVAQRLVLRSGFVALLTFLAICMPFFNVVVGLVGRCGWGIGDGAGLGAAVFAVGGSDWCGHEHLPCFARHSCRLMPLAHALLTQPARHCRSAVSRLTLQPVLLAAVHRLPLHDVVQGGAGELYAAGLLVRNQSLAQNGPLLTMRSPLM